ncbi:MAG TPA: DJ-1/PfpI family protein [Sulfuricaulis sp.]|nr:DJ-1/PfpI family protein [Sulfuricaulis sp.]
MQRKSVGIVVFEDVEVLDFSGPFEVFSVTRLNDEHRYQEPSPFEVRLIAETSQSVTTTGGMKVLPHFTFENCPVLDVLVVPGGIGTRKEMKNAAMLAFVKSRAPKAEVLTSVCTGALVLGSAGLLDGRRATTHWRSLELLEQLFPRVNVDKTSHVVEDGNVFTSAGISAGIDMALKVVAHYFGEVVARATAKHMEYPFPENNARRIQL